MSGLVLRARAGDREWMSFVKGAAIILLIAYHSMIFLRALDYVGGGMGRSKTMIELFPMPAFFLIAGLTAAPIRNWTFANAWRRRLSTLLYLYILWSAIRFLFYTFVPNVREENAGTDAGNPIANLGIFWWPISSYWFLYAMFLFALFAWLTRKIPVGWLIAATTVLSVAVSAGITATTNIGWDHSMRYAVFFMLGIALSKTLPRIVPHTRWWWAALACVAYLVIALGMGYSRAVAGMPGVRLLGQLAAVAAAITLAWFLVRLRPAAWVMWSGDRSFPIYLVHIFVIAVLTLGIAQFPALHLLPGNGLLVLGLMSVAVAVLSALLCRVLGRFHWLFLPSPRLRRWFASLWRRISGRGSAAAAQPPAVERGGAVR